MQHRVPCIISAPGSSLRRLVISASVAAALAGVVGCSSAPVTAFDLSAPGQPPRGTGGVAGQLVVVEPVALAPLESERILVKDASGAVSNLGGGQWSDRLPRLVQARLIQTFENGTRLRAAARPGDGVIAEYQLATELRAFQLDAATGEALVEISAKVIALPAGKIVRARVFTAREPAGTSSALDVTQALDRASGTVFLDIARWMTGGRVS